MNTKSKGTNAERELIHMFWNEKWTAVRIAGSGSSKYPCPDILASNNNSILAIEVKITKDKYKHFTNKEIKELKEFAAKFGAIPLIAIKFKGNDWFFMRVNDLQKTENNYSINLENIKNKGFVFINLINSF